MEVEPKYSRYTIRCGLAVVAGVRLRTATVELAQNGDAQARRYITDKFIQHLRKLKIVTDTAQATDTITYDRLDIIRK